MEPGTLGNTITSVEADSPAAKAGVRPGEKLLALDGRPVSDLIDYLSLSAVPHLELMLQDGSHTRTVQIKKDEHESVGISFASAVFDGVRLCGNRCVFCFVDQLPRGLRSSLYLKDEDYRLSFLQGNYVTLNRLTEDDLARIIDARLSPLYVSVHTTDPDLRGRLLGLDGQAPVLPLLERLTSAGLSIHAQAVICPGWNDGAALSRTVRDLSVLQPGIRSLALVPVGLSGHRGGLTPLQPFDREGARSLLGQVDKWQRSFLRRYGTRFVFAADEFYLLAGSRIPKAAKYEDYSQLQNGVGLIRSFKDDFLSAWRDWRARIKPGGVRVITGAAAAGMWADLARPLRKAGVELQVIPVENRLMGGDVTVTGLLAGRDILGALAGLDERPTFVPDVVLRRGEDLFLDDVRLEEFTAISGAEVIDTDARAFLAHAARALER